MRRERPSIRGFVGVAVLLGAGLLAVTVPAVGASAVEASRPVAQVPPPPSTVPAPGEATTTTVPQPGAATTSTVPGVPVGPQPPAAPGLFDVPGWIRKAIDGWFQGLVAAAVNPALDLLGHTLLATPRLVTGSRAGELWLVSLGLADATYVLLVTIGGWCCWPVSRCRSSTRSRRSRPGWWSARSPRT
jgi:hypothetical protein